MSKHYFSVTTNLRIIRLGVQGWFVQGSGLDTFFDRSVLSAARALQNMRFVLHATGKLRRFWLVHFRKEYVRSQLQNRRGDCYRCGACCSLLFTCPMLTKTGKCFIYGSCRSQVCKVFPIDQRDINEVYLNNCRCGYRFNQEARQYKSPRRLHWRQARKAELAK